MKEKPILFNSEMVRAVLDGKKTQTRRVVKNPIGEGTKENPLRMDLMKCPYGQVGGQLWVRETFRLFEAHNECGCSDPPCPCPEHGSIFMPRWASRIQLEITDIRVERLKDISEEDARAEGIERINMGLGNGESYKDYIDYPNDQWEWFSNPINSFKSLWDSINAKRGFAWDSNPYVWVVEFKRIN